MATHHHPCTGPPEEEEEEEEGTEVLDHLTVPLTVAPDHTDTEEGMVVDHNPGEGVTTMTDIRTAKR